MRPDPELRPIRRLRWPDKIECAFRECNRKPDRVIQWEKAGDSWVCEKHYKECIRKWKKYILTPKKESRGELEQDEKML